MRGAAGEIVGLRTRFPGGATRAVRGSCSGYFGSEQLLGRGPLLVVEGATDAAAGCALGFDTAGRASAFPGKFADAGVLHHCRDRDVVSVANRDGVGRRGASAFVAEALRVARSVRVTEP